MPTDRLSATFAALSDPTRRAILARLALGETSVSELAEPFAMSLPAVSKHLRVLSEAGLVQAEPVAQQGIYHLQAEPFEELDNWVATFRRLWNTRLDAFEEYMEELKKTEQD